MGILLRVALPLVANKNPCADQREAHGEADIHPTKWALSDYDEHLIIVVQR